MLTIVDIEPTTVCNLACPFCFGPKDIGAKDLGLDAWKYILDTIVECGGRGIVVSGGEPTLYPYIKGLLRYAQSINLSIVLSTHGRFKEKVLDVAQYCDWIALPVDGLNKTKIMRGDNWGFVEFIELVKSIRKVNSGIKIKLGTVVTQININEIHNMFEYVESNNVDLYFNNWKLYEYTPRRKFKQLKNSLQIDLDKFTELEENLLDKYSRVSSKVYFSHIKNHESGYVFIYHQGDVVICDVGAQLRDIHLGNILLHGKEVFDDLTRLNLENYLCNYNKTYK